MTLAKIGQSLCLLTTAHDRDLGVLIDQATTTTTH